MVVVAAILTLLIYFSMYVGTLYLFGAGLASGDYDVAFGGFLGFLILSVIGCLVIASMPTL